MSHLLENENNLKLLSLICSGEGVEINISAIAHHLKKHRNTIKNRIENLIDLNIIEKPFYPLTGLFQEYPFMVFSKDEFSRDEKTNKFVLEDPHIFAAFFFKEEFYNTLTIQYHKDLYSYQTWCDTIFEEDKITKLESQHPPNAIFFSTKRTLKYDPSAPLTLLKQFCHSNGEPNNNHKVDSVPLNNNKKNKYQLLNGHYLDDLSYKIIEMVLKGRSIRTNENYLAKELNLTRKTVEKKISNLLHEGIITKPVSVFPRLIAPPEFILVFSLFEIKKSYELVLRNMKEDPHINTIIKGNVGRYNFFIISVFFSIENHLKWQEEYQIRFPNLIGAVKNTYVSPNMVFSIKPNYVSLELIKKKLRALHGEKILKIMTD